MADEFLPDSTMPTSSELGGILLKYKLTIAPNNSDLHPILHHVEKYGAGLSYSLSHPAIPVNKQADGCNDTNQHGNIH